MNNKDKPLTYNCGLKKGAMRSIDKTMRDIDELLEGAVLQFSGPMRDDLRKKLIKELSELAETSFKKGFNRGHKGSYIEYVKTNEFPINISASVSRCLLPNLSRDIELNSTLRPKFIKKHNR
jgi:hypothetical protein